MSKFWNGKEIKDRFLGSRVITETYLGLKLIWKAIKSCFSGFWDNKQPWSNEESWKNK
jgi:hypothetical protein